ncbi:Serine/threonine-protein kinase smg1 [Irineochytrium annulatum]|nr:Serine/threonine-protein kinase smg1 [Irineochytrium annulatum]
MADVSRLISELQRITVLWEEKWFNGISHLQSDAQRRLARINGEIVRINAAAGLSPNVKESLKRKNYATIMDPVFASLEKLCADTFDAPATSPHEKWFEEKFGQRIRESISSFCHPIALEDLKEYWQPFLSIASDIGKETQRRKHLNLVDMSPYLASLQGTTVSIPDQSGVFTIDHFKADVSILSTKTKPKKVQIVATNGQTYTYLLKGLEDLHLDERMQQLVKTVNSLLHLDKESTERKLSARTYSVIPYGDTFGAIQWVENATQLFSLYKRWQQRDFAAKAMQRKEGDVLAEPTPGPMRPHESFYSKISSALKRSGVSRSTPRKHWPLSILKEVFMQLLNETPKDMISKELWCSASSPVEWWAKVSAFSRSLAVTSAIGYVIGLGDRHLDNIMLDTMTGDLIHIDYNVCFEKVALGLTGVEGQFRVACELVVNVLRENKEVILTLLDAFLHDPLIEWIQDLQEEYSKRARELNVNLQMLASRIEEYGPKATELEEAYALLSANAIAVVSNGLEHENSAKMAEELNILKEEIVKRQSDCANCAIERECR